MTSCSSILLVSSGPQDFTSPFPQSTHIFCSASFALTWIKKTPMLRPGIVCFAAIDSHEYLPLAQSRHQDHYRTANSNTLIEPSKTIQGDTTNPTGLYPKTISPWLSFPEKIWDICRSPRSSPSTVSEHGAGGANRNRDEPRITTITLVPRILLRGAVSPARCLPVFNNSHL